ncbi:MAG: DUF5794 domain-containing protein [archaeon]
MSQSQHPVALSLERQMGGATRLLATVMVLPLVDGIFPALVLAGALSSVTGIFEVGLLVFGGSATMAVILAEMDGTPREQARAVLAVGVVLVTLASLEAALAPAIASVLKLATFERFAALVIAAVAAKTASARVGEYLPRPAVIVVLGLVASFDPAGAALTVRPDPGLIARAAAAALVGTSFALTVALAGPRLRDLVDIDRFRFGSAVALGLLPLSILGLPVGGAPLAVIAVTGLFALDPDADGSAEGTVEDSTVVTDGGLESDGDTADAETTDVEDAVDRAPWL